MALLRVRYGLPFNALGQTTTNAIPSLWSRIGLASPSTARSCQLVHIREVQISLGSTRENIANALGVYSSVYA